MPTSNICRLCLHTAPITFPIVNTKAAEMLDSLTAIKMDSKDPISTMCLKCHLNLKLAYSIQQNILKSEEKLKSGVLNYQNHVGKYPIKTEIIQDKLESIDCKICDETIDVNSLASHTKHHFNEQFCDLCDENSKNINSYRTHVPEHPDDFPCKCEHCDTTFLYKSLYTIHRKSAHADEEILEAPKVKNPPKRRPEPKKDKPPRPWDTPGPPFKCNSCERNFPSKEKLKYHHNNSHQRKECPHCKKMVTAPNFSKHLQNHTSGPQVCDKCGKTYASSEKLRGHIFYQHRGKHYECEECKITFKSRQVLNGHRKRKHNGASHICETCGMTFIFSYHLKKHIERTHLKLRPHVCEICNKSFSGLKDIKSHRRQHTNETPYKCPDCGEGFKQNVSLRMHKKSKHNIIETVTCNCEVCGKGFASTHALAVHMRCH